MLGHAVSSLLSTHQVHQRLIPCFSNSHLLVPPRPLGEFLWEPFNGPKHAISLTRNNADFGKQENPLTTSSHVSMQDNYTSIIIKYFLHCPNSDSSILVGLEVISADGLCPAFNACPNWNIFQHHFGIEFCHEGCSYIRAILPFEFACYFGFIDQLTYRLSPQLMWLSGRLTLLAAEVVGSKPCKTPRLE